MCSHLVPCPTPQLFKTTVMGLSFLLLYKNKDIAMHGLYDLKRYILIKHEHKLTYHILTPLHGHTIPSKKRTPSPVLPQFPPSPLPPHSHLQNPGETPRKVATPKLPDNSSPQLPSSVDIVSPRGRRRWGSVLLPSVGRAIWRLGWAGLGGWVGFGLEGSAPCGLALLNGTGVGVYSF